MMYIVYMLLLMLVICKLLMMKDNAYKSYKGFGNRGGR